MKLNSLKEIRKLFHFEEICIVPIHLYLENLESRKI